MKTNSTLLIKKLLLLFLLISGLYYAKFFLVPISVGGFIAILILPFCKWLEVKKIPKFLAVSMCVVVILMFVAGLFYLFGWQISELLSDFTLIKEQATTKVIAVQLYILNHLDIGIEKQSQIILAEYPKVSTIMQLVAGSIKSVVINFILVFVYVFLLLFYRNHIKLFIIKLTPIDKKVEMEQIIYSTIHVAQQYLLGLSKMIFCLWVMYGIGFGILNINNFIFFAILCGLLEIVPFVGNILGTTITVLIAAILGASTQTLLSIVLIYGIVQFIQSWFLEPLVLGAQVKINPLFTIIALIIGELVWGVPGIVLAIPLVAMLKIIFDHIEPLKPYGFLIGEIEKKNK